VLSKNCGLASTLHEGHPYHKIVREPGKLRGKSALELAEYAKSDRLLEASIGMAAINSLIDIDETRCIEKNAFDILAEKGSGRNIAIVGHFPWIPKLKKGNYPPKDIQVMIKGLISSIDHCTIQKK
jgi:uncharacterized protein (DUF4213/DUF364 family)